MNEALSKLAVFDFMANLMTGLCAWTISAFVLEKVYFVSVNVNMSLNELVYVVIISYFLGITLQESSSWIQKKGVYKYDKLRKKAMEGSPVADEHLTDIEKKEITAYIRDAVGACDENNDIVYEYCKYYVQKNCDMSRIDRFESISAMSRGMSLYFLVLTICAAFSCFVGFTFLRLALSVVSAGLTLLFFYRFKRHSKKRYAAFMRTFYYDNPEKIKLWRDSKRKRAQNNGKRENTGNGGNAL